MMNRYETRGIDPTTTTLKLIAENLNVSADYLLGLTNDPQGKLMESDLNRNERDLVDAYRRGGSS